MSASLVRALWRVLKITPQSPTFTTQQNSSLPDRLGVVITLNLWATHSFLAYAAKSITSRPVKNKTTPVFPIVLNLFFKQNKGIYTHTARHDAIVTTTHGGLVGGIRGMSFIFVCYHSHEWILPLRDVQPCGGADPKISSNHFIYDPFSMNEPAPKYDRQLPNFSYAKESEHQRANENALPSV